MGLYISASLHAEAAQGANVNVAVEETSLLVEQRAFEANVDAFRTEADVLGYLLNVWE